jgi:uncharacterized protein YbaA (DUF1428 family)
MYKYRIVFSEIYKEFWAQRLPEDKRKNVPAVETNGSFTAISAETKERVDFLVKELKSKGFKRDYLLDDLIKKHKNE